MLTDKETIIPPFWNHDIIRIDIEPQKEFLHKAGLMKAMAFNFVGKVLIMDLDTIINDKIDELEGIDCEIAMADDPVETKWDVFLGTRKKNAGVIIINSPNILTDFMEIWNKNNIFETYKDEIIFSLLTKKYKFVSLNQKYNCCNIQENAKIYHFHGKYKSFIKEFPCYIL